MKLLQEFKEKYGLGQYSNLIEIEKDIIDIFSTLSELETEESVFIYADSDKRQILYYNKEKSRTLCYNTSLMEELLKSKYDEPTIEIHLKTVIKLIFKLRGKNHPLLGYIPIVDYCRTGMKWYHWLDGQRELEKRAESIRRVKEKKPPINFLELVESKRKSGEFENLTDKESVFLTLFNDLIEDYNEDGQSVLKKNSGKNSFVFLYSPQHDTFIMNKFKVIKRLKTKIDVTNIDKNGLEELAMSFLNNHLKLNVETVMM